MTIGVKDVRAIGLGIGTRVVPEWPEGWTASPDWEEVEWRGCSDATGRMIGSAWEGQAGILHVVDYPVDEICVLLTGSVAVTDDSGERRVFRAGEAFLFPRGFTGKWETLEPSSKIFVVLEPAPESA
ncbi:cupin domain-containing protein [Nocardia sp. NPDC004123]